MGDGRGIETELKYLGADLDDLRRRLAANDAVVESPRRLEVNLVFDDAERRLRASYRLLRLRDGDELTTKARLVDDRFKSRREVTVHIADGDVEALLGELGYAVMWRYEKLREGWDLEGMWITIDEVPFLGQVVEIEGDPARIDGTAERLGLDGLATSAETYMTLFADYLRQRGLSWRDMTFDEEARTPPSD